MGIIGKIKSWMVITTSNEADILQTFYDFLTLLRDALLLW